MLTELLDLLRHYPKWRYQGLVLKQVHGMSPRPCGPTCPTMLREVSFCRGRLGELLQHFLRAARAIVVGRRGGRAECEFLYPDGCRSLEDAVDRLVAAVTPGEWPDLDRRVQDMIQQQFGSLVHVCTTSAHLLMKLETAMLEEAVAFARHPAGGR